MLRFVAIHFYYCFNSLCLQFEIIKNELPKESSVLNNEVDGLHNDLMALKQVLN